MDAKFLRAAASTQTLCGFIPMLRFVLLLGLLQLPAPAISPCHVGKSTATDPVAPLNIKEVCRLERRMSLLTDGMSWNAAMNKLGVSRRHLLVTAHGGMTYSYLGNGYNLATPFSSKQTSMRLLLLDGNGRVVKDVEWH